MQTFRSPASKLKDEIGLKVEQNEEESKSLAFILTWVCAVTEIKISRKLLGNLLISKHHSKGDRTGYMLCLAFVFTMSIMICSLALTYCAVNNSNLWKKNDDDKK
jgi:hypothetical protein